MENNKVVKDMTDVKAKMPTLKETVTSMKGKNNAHDEDVLHGSHKPLDAEIDPAVDITKSDNERS